MKTTMQPKTTTPPAAMPVPAPPPLAAPDWVIETPQGSEYSLVMQDDNLTWEQDVTLTRAEYITLKRHIAGLRGIIPVPAAVPAAAPVPKLDPMNVLAKFSPEQEQEVRGALLARLIQQLAGMDTHEVRQIAWYADIEEAKCGCDTPAEEFITGLVLCYQIRGLTPDDVAHDLESFRENFDSMAKAARVFSARYPEAVKSAA